ncbi:hypothetical protein M5D96_000738 [Drosophila gunungcola]|uniref:Uncharacterized protein n=1 Tax=Drosophila gunungcola TaxID=103775 RepID=A0A9Q0BUR9_9MUSC|nr:hypothetical protein M5D96_000738 [Drosophila gunungcola]
MIAYPVQILSDTCVDACERIARLPTLVAEGHHSQLNPMRVISHHQRTTRVALI